MYLWKYLPDLIFHIWVEKIYCDLKFWAIIVENILEFRYPYSLVLHITGMKKIYYSAKDKFLYYLWLRNGTGWFGRQIWIFNGSRNVPISKFVQKQNNQHYLALTDCSYLQSPIDLRTSLSAALSQKRSYQFLIYSDLRYSSHRGRHNKIFKSACQIPQFHFSIRKNTKIYL